MAGHDNIPTLAEQVSRVPMQPGCYLWKDAKGDVIYVGKAKNLRSRMRQYVTLQDERQKIPLMMQLVASFDYIVVENEHEALVLERNLIGQYHPYFNVDLKDDKSYPFIAITKSDLFPAIKYTRERHKPGTRYFGPYTDSRAARETIDTLRKVIPICSASCAEWRRCRRIVESHKGEEDIVNMICAQNGRPCFDFHVGRGPGACVGAISPADYAKNVKRVERFLSGHRKDVVDELTSEMTDAAEALDFERAARVKRRLEVIRGLDDRQQVVFPSSVDLDVIGFYREETISAACVFVVREGRTVRTCEFILDKGLDVDEEELQGFVLGNLLPLGVDIGGHTVKQQRLDGFKLSGIDSCAEHTARRLEDVDTVGHGITMGATAIHILVYAIGDITLVLGGKANSHIVRTLELGGSAIGRLHGAHRVNIELAIEIDQRLAIGKVSAVSV